MADCKIVSTDYFADKKRKSEKITVLTAYDYPTAKLIDEAGIDSILVGDSLGMVVLGYESTVDVTMDEMIHHAKAVRRGTERALLIGDMPYQAYQVNKDKALGNAQRFVKEGGCDAVKIEWCTSAIDVTRQIIEAGIPVIGHIGLTPQTASELGGFKVQGKDTATAQKLLGQADAFQGAGAFAIVLECIPDRVAEYITKIIDIPTIGIGAGSGCDGQVLVTNDLLGIFDKFTPKFVKQYVKLSTQMLEAFKTYKTDVENGKFPLKEHSYAIKDEEFQKLTSKNSG